MTEAQPRLVITGMGCEHPEHELSNKFFEDLDIGTNAEWIEQRTGIRSRRSILDADTIIALKNAETTIEELTKKGFITSQADMSRNPWQKTLERSGEDQSVKIDTVIAGSSVFDHEIPASACMIAGELGIESLAFDVNSACSSFVANLHVSRGLMCAGSTERIAIFNAERYSTRVNFSDRSSCILFGDGAASSLLEKDSSKPGLEILDTHMASAPSSHSLVKIPLFDYFSQQGSAVQKFAITKTMAITKEILERNHLATSDVRYFVGHQANLRMVSSAASKLGFQEDQHLFNVDTKGNQGGAGAPSVLATHWEQFKPGDLIVVSVVGSGLTWGSALLKRV